MVVSEEIILATANVFSTSGHREFLQVFLPQASIVFQDVVSVQVITDT